jgi:hypothetical protein
MKRTPTKRNKTVTALGDPKPQFVSLVAGGANQVPIRVVKSEELQPAAKGQEDMTTQAADQFNIVKLVFHNAQYATIQSVKTWLTAGGYGECEIATVDNTFVVTSGAQKGDDELQTRVIRDPSGVDVYVAVMTEESTEVSALAEVAVKADVLETLTMKFDGWMAGWTGGTSLADGIDDGFDGIPPGLAEVMGVFYTIIGNAIRANATAEITSICAELADIAIKLAVMFPAPPKEMAEKTEEATKMFKANAAVADMIVNSMKASPKDLPAPLKGAPEGAIDATTTVNVQNQAVIDTQTGGTTTGKVPLPAGQTNNVPEHGTVPGAAPALPEGQAIDKPEHGTPGGGDLPAGQTNDTPPHGTGAGGSLPAGQANDKPIHGTGNGGNLPQGQTTDTPPHGTVGARKEGEDAQSEVVTPNATPGIMETFEGFRAAMGSMAETMAAMTAGIQSMKADTVAVLERVSAVESGGRQSRKGADIDFATISTQQPVAVPSTEARKTAEVMDSLYMNGILGLRRS